MHSSRQDMRSPASEVSHHTEKDRPTSRSPAPEAEPYELISLRRELERAKRDAAELGKKVAARNTQYLLREEELSQQIRDAAEQSGMGTLPPGTDLATSAARQRARAFRMQDEAEAQQRQRRIVELEEEIANVNKKIAARNHEEELAGVALSRLKEQLGRLEKESTLIAAHVQTVLDTVKGTKETSFHNRQSLAEALNVSLVDEGVSEDDLPHPSGTIEAEYCNVNLRMFSAACQLVTETKRLVSAFTAEAELQASVFESVETAHLERKRQLEEQSEVLVDAQSALKTLEERLGALDRELSDLRARRAELEATVNREGTVESLIEQELQLQHDISVVEGQAAEAVRKKETVSTQRDQAMRSRKEALDRLTDEEISLKSAEEALHAAEKHRDDIDTERTHLERSSRVSSDNIKNLEQERIRLREEIAAAHEEKIMMDERQRKLEVQQDEAAGNLRAAIREQEAAQEALTNKKRWLEDLQAEVEKQKERHSDLVRERSTLKQQVQLANYEAANAQQAADSVNQQLEYSRSLLPKTHPAAGGGSFKGTLPSGVKPPQRIQHAKQPQESVAALRTMLAKHETASSGHGSRPTTPQPKPEQQAPRVVQPQSIPAFPSTPAAQQAPVAAARSVSSSSANSMANIQSKLHDILARRHERGLQ